MPTLQYYALHVSADTSFHEVILEWERREWHQASLGCNSRPPVPEQKAELPSFLSLYSGKHRILSTHWLFHRFPYPCQEEESLKSRNLDKALGCLEWSIPKLLFTMTQRKALSDAIDKIQELCSKTMAKPRQVDLNHLQLTPKE